MVRLKYFPKHKKGEPLLPCGPEVWHESGKYHTHEARPTKKWLVWAFKQKIAKARPSVKAMALQRFVSQNKHGMVQQLNTARVLHRGSAISYYEPRKKR